MSISDSIKKPSLAMIAVVAIAAVAGSYVARSVVESLFQPADKDAAIEKVLAKAADSINRTLPMMVDKVTRLDSTAVLADRKLMYRYTILNVDPVPEREALIEYL